MSTKLDKAMFVFVIQVKIESADSEFYWCEQKEIVKIEIAFVQVLKFISYIYCKFI